MYQIDSIKLQQKMIECGFSSITALADAANVSRDTISGIISAKRRPQASVMYAIAGALKLSSEEAGAIFFLHLSLRKTQRNEVPQMEPIAVNMKEAEKWKIKNLLEPKWSSIWLTSIRKLKGS